MKRMPSAMMTPPPSGSSIAIDPRKKARAAANGRELVVRSRDIQPLLEIFVDDGAPQQSKNHHDDFVVVDRDDYSVVCALRQALLPRARKGLTTRAACGVRSCDRRVSQIYLHNGARNFLERPVPLPNALGTLECLEVLDLRYFSFRRLPRSIENLKRLQVLSLVHCHHLAILPREIGKLERLETLILSHATGLRCLTEELGRLASLQTLDLSYTTSLSELPQTMGNLDRLELLNLFASGIGSLPLTVGRLKHRLRWLGLYSVRNLSALPLEVMDHVRARSTTVPKHRNAHMARPTVLTFENLGTLVGDLALRRLETTHAKQPAVAMEKLWPLLLDGTQTMVPQDPGDNRHRISQHLRKIADTLFAPGDRRDLGFKRLSYNLSVPEALYLMLDIGRESFLETIIAARQPTNTAGKK